MFVGRGGEARASHSAISRCAEQGECDVRHAGGHRHKAAVAGARRLAGAPTRHKRGAGVRGAWRGAWWAWRGAWWSPLRPWEAPLRPWGAWLLRPASRGGYRGILGAVLGSVLGAVCRPARRCHPTPAGVYPTCSPHLVLLRQSPGLLSVCATVPQWLAPSHPNTAVGAERPAPPVPPAQTCHKPRTRSQC
jgi:hypothetical protein